MNEEFAPIAVAGSSKSASKRSSRLFKAGAMLAVSAGMLGAIGGVASAQTVDPVPTPSGTTAAHAQVESGITLTHLTSSFTLTGAPGQTVTSLGAVGYNVETNNPSGYAVSIKASADAMVGAIPGNTDSIPVNVLTASDGSLDTYNGLTTSAQPFHAQGERSVNGGDELSTDFQMRIPVVNADIYTTTLTYTATTL